MAAIPFEPVTFPGDAPVQVFTSGSSSAPRGTLLAFDVQGHGVIIEVTESGLTKREFRPWNAIAYITQTQ